MGRSFLKFIAKDCDPTSAKDKSLPYTAYLVEYLQDGITKFDIVTADKKVDIFDHYWDNYRSDLINMSQSSGTINPRMWNPPSEKK
ncbi:hypothetical protein Syn7803C76_209 [Synechococcus phage ACG-2014b]|jgi:hypothetical protein|uniref:Uncharacterized protein n=2 Tax=Synechococcus phage ACG-2014b TaxID=1493508 RepID=A0A0E3FYQ1_9CAUD|nr:hypothetical protein ABF04_gp209 [Synechococcus phage ACG-2014b]YP_009779835.1 hypothetical protein HOQ67_gp207 [Synechococcus phage ACG-2014b]YP_009780053.1 hypothetical protein HOQ68_gp210 [Synechococcus phage ACG-2014b]AIX17429.1 hypothetical protein Syn7803C61_207 [Synechococcus phage ACG-2014b]AIX17644.1 hypothetical protein Syn7803C66_207 [Synechococcus phage ACG-2014b]AIX18076.1 hypothetical protein Syn7803C68_208 [Synechococcus phage ACG-2014b]AIX18291.1 hypothetical protein Syn780